MKLVEWRNMIIELKNYAPFSRIEKFYLLYNTLQSTKIIPYPTLPKEEMQIFSHSYFLADQVRPK